MTTLDKIIIIIEIVCALTLKGLLIILRSSAYVQFKRDYNNMR